MSIDERLRQLELELTKQKRRNKGLLAAMAVLSVAMIFAFVLIGPLGGAQAQNGGQVVAREFLLVDEEGTARVSLATSPLPSSYGYPRLTLWDKDGTVAAILVADDDGSSLTLNDAQGQHRLLLTVGRGGAFIHLYDAREQSRLDLGVDGDGPYIGFRDDNGKLRATMGYLNQTSSPHLILCDEKGTPIWSAPE